MGSLCVSGDTYNTTPRYKATCQVWLTFTLTAGFCVSIVASADLVGAGEGGVRRGGEGGIVCSGEAGDVVFQGGLGEHGGRPGPEPQQS